MAYKPIIKKGKFKFLRAPNKGIRRNEKLENLPPLEN